MLATDRPYPSSLSATTVCPFCGAGCGILLRGAAAFPLQHHSVGQGALCLRGWCGAEPLWSPLRVTAPVVRGRHGIPGAPPVEDALALVAARLREIRERHGAGSIGILGSARITVEESRLLLRLARALGTPHLDSFQRLGYLPFPPAPLERIESAGRLIVLGADLAGLHTQVARRVLRAQSGGTPVRFVHSRHVQLARLAGEHVVAPPGRELEALGPLAAGDLVLVSSELALAGQGARAAALLPRDRTLFLGEYANQRGMVEAGVHPGADGLSAFEMLRRAAAGELKALLVFADDPFEFFPALAGEAFARLELSVVTDAVETPTARRADIVLPGALFAEKDGTVVSTGGEFQELAAAVAPPAGWTEGRIASHLIERLDGGAAALPAPAPPAVGGDGVAPEPPEPARPFLAALDAGWMWSGHALIRASATAWREARTVFADFPQGFVSIHPEDARTLGIRMFAPVTLESADGAVTLPARPSPRAAQGTVLVPIHLWESAGANLGALVFDEGLRIPVFRPRAVRVSRQEGR